MLNKVFFFLEYDRSDENKHFKLQEMKSVRVFKQIFSVLKNLVLDFTYSENSIMKGDRIVCVCMCLCECVCVSL